MSSTERIEQPPLAASQNEMASPKDDPAGAGLTGETSSTSPGAEPRSDLLVPEDVTTPNKNKEFVDRYSRTINTKDISGVFARNRRRHSDSDITVYPKVLSTQNHISPSHLLHATDSNSDFSVWIARIRAYFDLGNLKLASPNIQRQFLASFMNKELWIILSGKESVSEKSSPLNPNDLWSGIFLSLTNFFGLPDHSLLKSTQDLVYRRFTQCGQEKPMLTRFNLRELEIMSEAKQASLGKSMINVKYCPKCGSLVQNRKFVLCKSCYLMKRSEQDSEGKYADSSRMPTKFSQCLSCHKKCQSEDALLCEKCLTIRQLNESREGLAVTPPWITCGEACQTKNTTFCNNHRPEHQVASATLPINKQNAENPLSSQPTNGAHVPFNRTSKKANPGHIAAQGTRIAWKGRGGRAPVQGRSYSPAVPRIGRSDPGPRYRRTDALADANGARKTTPHLSAAPQGQTPRTHQTVKNTQ